MRLFLSMCLNSRCTEGRERERLDETNETVETTTCKYKIVQRVRERLKETKETMETMETSDMQIQNCMERQRLEVTKEIRETMETSGDTSMQCVWRY